MSNIHVDFDFTSLSSLDQDELLQRHAGMHEVLDVLRGNTCSYANAEFFLDATEAELVRRAAEGSYKSAPRKDRPFRRSSAR